MVAGEINSEKNNSEQAIEFKGCSVELELNPETKQVEAKVTPSFVSSEINTEFLFNLIKDSPYSEFFFLQENFDNVLMAVRAFESTRIVVAEIRDSVSTVEIDSDKMKAYLTIIKAYAGIKTTEQNIKDLLLKNNISKGILEEVINKAIEQGETKKVLIAEGKESTHGSDSKFECLVKECLFKAPQIDESGNVDFFDLQEFILVEENIPLMKRYPPANGVAGYDVLGQPILSKAGKDIPFRIYEGVCVSPEDETVLISTTKGHPVIYPDGVKVDPILRLARVDLSTGNINFDGSVYIKGDIADNMTVKATGNVVVDGVVQKARIKAGGDIFVKNGIIGGSVSSRKDSKIQNYGANLFAEGDIQARFVDNASLEAGNIVLVREYIRHSQTRAVQSVFLGKQGGKGQLIGGRTTATKSVHAKWMGTVTDVETYVEVGISPQLRAEYDGLSLKIYQKNHNLTSLIINFGYLKDKIKKEALEKEISKVEKTAVIEAAKLIKADLEEIEILNASREELEKLMQEANDSFVKVEKRVYRNLIVKIKDTQYRVNEECIGGEFTLQGRRVDFTGKPKK